MAIKINEGLYYIDEDTDLVYSDDDDGWYFQFADATSEIYPDIQTAVREFLGREVTYET